MPGIPGETELKTSAVDLFEVADATTGGGNNGENQFNWAAAAKDMCVAGDRLIEICLTVAHGSTYQIARALRSQISDIKSEIVLAWGSVRTKR